MTVTTGKAQRCQCLLPDEGEVIRIFDEEFALKVRPEETGGMYAVLSGTVAPGGGPPLHAHPSSETVYVLSGEVLLTQRAGQDVSTFLAGPGAVVHAPAGAPHRFENVGSDRASILMVLTANMVDFLRELGAAFPPGAEPNMEKMLSIHEKYQVETFHGGEGSRPEPAKDGATSSRARALAWRFEYANEELMDLLEGCTDEQWRATCDDTGWSIAVQAHHIAVNMPIIAGLLADAAGGHPHQPPPTEKLDEINAQHATAFANVGRDETLALLRREGTNAASVYRLMTDEELEQPAVIQPGGAAPNIARLIEALAIGEIEQHGAAIRQAILGN